MSKVEKVIRLIVTIVAMLLIVASFNLIMAELNIEDRSTLVFLHIAFPSALGFICGNSINNMLSLPEPKKSEKEKDDHER